MRTTLKKSLYEIACHFYHTLIFRLLHWVLQDVRQSGLGFGARRTKLSRRILLFWASLTDVKHHFAGSPRNLHDFVYVVTLNLPF